ncbi:MAG: UDP-N-acetylmuramoyl-L-alanine--D-glutamate ligase [Candidatus Krumholzibacteriota bacterium]|nr:UDP-N-acetylmuramoyl-L-alanine--D-glutamate ligase [Candidatus Krumholzibacteriota bacterium]
MQTTGEGYRGKRVLVLGLARSGRAAMRLLSAAGADVLGADEKGGIEGVEGAVCLGPFSAELLDGRDEVILSPGIPIDHPIVLAAAERGIPVTGELAFGARFVRAPIVAVTGTNGKSTTVSMIGAILDAAGIPAIVAGNVGLPLSEVAADLGPDGVCVLEVSSFQLEAAADFRARAAGILNMTPDHLDRYADAEAYYAAKLRIAKNARPDDLFFFNAEDERCRAAAAAFPGETVSFSVRRALDAGVFLDGDRLVRASAGRRETIMRRGELGVVGTHNVENALAAIAALSWLDVPAAAICRALAGFRGLPHRMELVAVLDGVSWYNDSKATNVEAAVKSLEGLDAPVVLIAGGHDKGGDFTKLLAVRDRLVAVITIGEAAPLIEEALGGRVPVAGASVMQRAVETAARTATAGQLVVLSPACASFDQFEDFEHRGEVFRACVRALEER